MHAFFQRADILSSRVIGAAIEVHREKRAVLIESIYEKCLMHELSLQGVPSTNQKQVLIRYKDLVFEEKLRFDLLVGDCLLIEVKSVERVLPVHKAQLLSYMKLLSIPLGLFINFHEPVLKSEITRLMLAGVNEQ